MTMIRNAFIFACAVGASACSENSPAGPATHPVEAPPGMVVSNALAASRIQGSGDGASSVAASAENAAYVSAAPGTFPRAFSVTIRNETRNGAPTNALVLDGGFDPVVIDAAEGDELLLTLSFIGGGSASIRVKVPPRHPPAVVRTTPQKGRTDVAVNANVTIIFSEPVDGSTVTPTTVTLLLDGKRTGGAVEISGNGLRADFIPASQLEPLRTYSLVVSQEIRDLDGDALVEAVNATFTTAAVSRMMVTVVTKAISSEWLDPDGYSVSLTGQPGRTIGANGTIAIESLPVGSYEVALDGIGGECALETPSPVQASVLAGLTSTVTFEVTCGPTTDLEGTLAFVSERDLNSEIYSVKADGTGLVRLTSHPARDTDPAWSPDGTRILFVSSRDWGANALASDVYVMNADGSNVMRLTFSGIANAPAWSPDGRKIVYSDLKNGQFGIYVASLDNLSAATNVAFEAGYQTDPAWSPDGKKIAFTSDWRAYDFLYDLYVANLDGSGISMLMGGPFLWNDGLRFYFQSAWSPDGQKIAVVRCPYAANNCYGGSTIVIANADGTNVTSLVETVGYASPSWSPDGRTIAYSAKGCETCVGSLRYISTDGSRRGLILSGGHSPSWRP